MLESSETIAVSCVSNDGVGASRFSTTQISLSGTDGRRLSEQIEAVNFRLRTSGSEYRSDFHVAGDPTLLLIQLGQLKVSLPDGESMLFSKGDMFIAQDYLKADIEFVKGVHGHRAEVVSQERLIALHLKLDKR